MVEEVADVAEAESMSEGSFLEPGRNCWRIETARRVGLCVDGECYFAAMRESLIGAQRSIAIAAWDIHSRLELVRPNPYDGWPTALGALLQRLLSDRSELEVFILLWDYAPIYALEREPLFFGEAPWGETPWGNAIDKRDARLHFIKDDAHPLMASQHQKLVVVDGRIAWCGGFDASKWRWDSSQHLCEDPQRRDPDGDPYPPFHDLQMLVDGAAAAALAELFAQRWANAGGGHPEVLQEGVCAKGDPWPGSLKPMLRDQRVGIARTQPAHNGRAEVRESERLFLDMIHAARESIYIENQYLTSRVVADALRQSLEAEQGPQIVIILPRQTGHWLEQHTMDVLRARLLAGLRDADRRGRLRVYYPDVPGLGEQCLMVHAKLMIVDDRILRLGSSNLSNRSMGLDSECDLCLVAESGAARDRIRNLRRRLLAMFLSVDTQAVADAERRPDGLGDAVEYLRDRAGERADRGDDAAARLRLCPLDTALDPEWDRQLPDERLIDPDRPLAPGWVGDVMVGEENRPYVRWRAFVGLGTVVVFLVLAVVWRWTPAADWLSPSTLTAAAEALSGTLWGLPLALAGFVVASLVAVPVTLLILVTTLVFEPLTGGILALSGSTLSAIAGYAIGSYTGAKSVERRMGGRLGDLREQLAHRGIATVITLRIVPVAPFAVLNLLAGAMSVRLRDYIIGTVIGMAPAVIGMAVFSEGLLSLLGRADLRAFALIVAGLLALVGLAWFGQRLLRSRA